MVFLQSYLHNHNVHVCLFHSGRHRHRRHTARSVLYERQPVLDLFHHLFHYRANHADGQPERIQQGIFPAPRSSAIWHHVRIFQDRDTGHPVGSHIYILCSAGRADALHVGSTPAALLNHPHCADGTRLRADRLCTDREIPRPEQSRDLRPATMDVCHPGDLPRGYHERPHPLASAEVEPAAGHLH